MNKKAGNHAAYPKNLPLYVERVLLECSDEEHPVSVRHINEALRNEFGIETSMDTVRKTLKAMLDGYKEPYGYHPEESCLRPRYRICEPVSDGEVSPNKKGFYFIKRLQIDLPQVEYAVNLIRRNSTHETAKDAEVGFASLLSKHQRSELFWRTGRPRRRLGIDLEQVLMNLEDLNSAIEENRYISFEYRSGKPAECNNVFPCCVGFDDGYYYLVAKSEVEAQTKLGMPIRNRVYRVDKMGTIAFEGKINLASEEIDKERSSAKAFFDGSVNRMPSPDMVTVLLSCRGGKTARYIEENFGSRRGFACLSMKGADIQRFRIPDVSYDGMKVWALKWLDSVEVESPQALRDDIVSIVENNVYGSFRKVQPSFRL